MDILKEYIGLFLKEAAIRDFDGLGLYVKNDGNHMTFIIYDAKVMIQKTKENKRLTFEPNMIRGMIKVQRRGHFGACHGAWDVAAVAATSGYGPTMYDIAMSNVPTKTLMPDRSDVSPSAQSIWKYYKNNREDVQALRLDTKPKEKESGSEPLTNINELNQELSNNDASDDCFSMHMGPAKSYLDYAYRLVGEPIDISTPLHVHNKIMERLNKVNKGEAFEMLLQSGAAKFFGMAG